MVEIGLADESTEAPPTQLCVLPDTTVALNVARPAGSQSLLTGTVDLDAMLASSAAESEAGDPLDWTAA